MGKRRTLVETATLDETVNAHNCKGNSKHRLNTGDKRLKVKNGRSQNYYCSDCAKKIIISDIAKLQELLKQFE